MVFVVVAGVIILDQLTKFIASRNLSLNAPVSVLKGVFSFTLVHNRGAAFGILNNQVPLFVFTSIFAVILIYWELKNNKHRTLYSLALGLILAGALGNLIDRVIFGYVIDFLDFQVWPVFNLADSAITVGAVLLGLNLLSSKGKNAS
jgi:signal peptidase II